MGTKRLLIAAAALILIGSAVYGIALQPADADAVAEDTGSISWILISSVLVFAMVPGVAFF